VHHPAFTVKTILDDIVEHDVAVRIKPKTRVITPSAKQRNRVGFVVYLMKIDNLIKNQYHSSNRPHNLQYFFIFIYSG